MIRQTRNKGETDRDTDRQAKRRAGNRHVQTKTKGADGKADRSQKDRWIGANGRTKGQMRQNKREMRATRKWERGKKVCVRSGKRE